VLWLAGRVGVPLLQMKESGDHTQDFLFRSCAKKTLALLSHRHIKELVAAAPGIIQTRRFLEISIASGFDLNLVPYNSVSSY